MASAEPRTETRTVERVVKDTVTETVGVTLHLSTLEAETVLDILGLVTTIDGPRTRAACAVLSALNDAGYQFNYDRKINTWGSVKLYN